MGLLKKKEKVYGKCIICDTELELKEFKKKIELRTLVGTYLGFGIICDTCCDKLREKK